MTAQTPARKSDGNGIPAPVIRWIRATGRTVAQCDDCPWSALPADLAVARLHVKSHPSHRVHMSQSTVTDVWAETTDGVDWAEAVRDL